MPLELKRCNHAFTLIMPYVVAELDTGSWPFSPVMERCVRAADCTPKAHCTVLAMQELRLLFFCGSISHYLMSSWHMAVFVDNSFGNMTPLCLKMYSPLVSGRSTFDT